MFDELIFTVPQVIDYQVTLGKEAGRDTLSFRVEVTEESQPVSEATSKAILSDTVIKKAVAANGLAIPRVELVGQGKLGRKTKRLIVDEREGG